MPGKTNISWATDTWNPVTGCDKVSPGCKHCYAETLAPKLYKEGFKVTLRPERLDQPIRWKKPRMIFVNSMSDMFHEDIDREYIYKVFDVMNQAQHHIFQVLTKRAHRMVSFTTYRPDSVIQRPLNWTDNIWQGVSVENKDYLNRIDDLRQIPAKVRFLSIEPLLGQIDDMDLTGIHWVIVGGESGRYARPMDLEWARRIRDICKEQGVAFFFKQIGGEYNKKEKMEEFPDDLRIQEYPG